VSDSFVFALPPGGKRPSLVDGLYEDLPTRVTARVDGAQLVCPLPRARFAALHVAEEFGLGADFVEAYLAASRARGGAFRIGAEEGEAWWRYVRARGALRLTWPSADVVVPDLMLFAEKASGRVSRVLIWPDDTSTIVVPDAADFVALKPSVIMAGLTMRKAPVLIPRAEVLARLGDRAERGSATPVPHKLYRGGEGHVFALAALRAAEGRVAKDFHAVASDEVVDA
jgi:hypothetical protein